MYFMFWSVGFVGAVSLYRMEIVGFVYVLLSIAFKIILVSSIEEIYNLKIR